MSARVLVISPHYDDETLGCGGTLALLSRRGCEIHLVWCTDGGRHGALRREEASHATRVLAPASTTHLPFPELALGERAGPLAQALSRSICEVRPTEILCPHRDDGHPDHRACARATVLAARRAAISRHDRWEGARVFGYEVWAPLRHVARLVNISPVAVAKRRALRHYRSQFASRRIDRACLALNRYRGLLSGVAAAEAFSSIPLDGPPVPERL